MRLSLLWSFVYDTMIRNMSITAGTKGINTIGNKKITFDFYNLS